MIRLVRVSHFVTLDMISKISHRCERIPYLPCLLQINCPDFSSSRVKFQKSLCFAVSYPATYVCWFPLWCFDTLCLVVCSVAHFTPDFKIDDDFAELWGKPNIYDVSPKNLSRGNLENTQGKCEMCVDRSFLKGKNPSLPAPIPIFMKIPL